MADASAGGGLQTTENASEIIKAADESVARLATMVDPEDAFDGDYKQRTKVECTKVLYDSFVRQKSYRRDHMSEALGSDGEHEVDRDTGRGGSSSATSYAGMRSGSVYFHGVGGSGGTTPAGGTFSVSRGDFQRSENGGATVNVNRTAAAKPQLLCDLAALTGRHVALHIEECRKWSSLTRKEVIDAMSKEFLRELTNHCQGVVRRRARNTPTGTVGFDKLDAQGQILKELQDHVTASSWQTMPDASKRRAFETLEELYREASTLRDAPPGPQADLVKTAFGKNLFPRFDRIGDKQRPLDGGLKSDWHRVDDRSPSPYGIWEYTLRQVLAESPWSTLTRTGDPGLFARTTAAIHESMAPTGEKLETLGRYLRERVEYSDLKAEPKVMADFENLTDLVNAYQDLFADLYEERSAMAAELGAWPEKAESNIWVTVEPGAASRYEGSPVSAEEVENGLNASLTGRSHNEAAAELLTMFLKTAGGKASTTFSFCHAKDRREIPLQGRTKVLADILLLWQRRKEAFTKHCGAADRNEYIVPVCTGVPGVGKTRILEEWETIFRHLGIDEQHSLGILVLYYNGHSPCTFDRTLPIEVSFSLRLLHRYFLDGGLVDFGSFEQMMTLSSLASPTSGLTLTRAILAIVQHASPNYQTSQEPFSLYAGIDEFQAIAKLPVESDGVGKLEKLVSLFVDTSIALVPYNIHLYVMFAGTQWGKIVGVGSSNPIVEGIVIPFMNKEHYFGIAGYLYPEGVRDKAFKRHLMVLGDIARSAVEFCWRTKALHALLKETNSPIENSLCNLRRQLITSYSSQWIEGFPSTSLTHLVAFCLSGVSIDVAAVPVPAIDFGPPPPDRPEESVKNPPPPLPPPPLTWQLLADRGLLIITKKDTADGTNEVRNYPVIPFIAFLQCASLYNKSISEVADGRQHGAEECFLKALSECMKLTTNDHEPWKNWELFGAYFHCLRINSLLLIKQTTIPLDDLFPAGGHSNIPASSLCHVTLRPARVLHSETPLSATSDLTKVEQLGFRGGNYINIIDSPHCYIVINSTNAPAVDMYFVLHEDTSYGQDHSPPPSEAAPAAAATSKVGDIGSGLCDDIPCAPRIGLGGASGSGSICLGGGELSRSEDAAAGDIDRLGDGVESIGLSDARGDIGLRARGAGDAAPDPSEQHEPRGEGRRRKRIFLITDQRKWKGACLTKAVVEKCHKDMMATRPSHLDEEHSPCVMIAGLFSGLADYGRQGLPASNITSNCFVFSQESLRQYHGSLANHPCASNWLDVHTSPATHIEAVLGTSANAKKTVRCIKALVDEQNKIYLSFKQLNEDLRKLNCDEIDEAFETAFLFANNNRKYTT